MRGNKRGFKENIDNPTIVRDDGHNKDYALPEQNNSGIEEDYSEEKLVPGGHAGYVRTQDYVDHGHVTVPNSGDYDQYDVHNPDHTSEHRIGDKTFVTDNQHLNNEDFIKHDRGIDVTGHAHLELDEEHENVFSHDEAFSHFNGEESESNDRHIFELEYDHSQNSQLQDFDDDFSFNSNEIYISDDAGDELSRNERGFDDDSDHFFDNSYDNSQQQFGFGEFDLDHKNTANQHEGFGHDDLFFKQKVADRSSDLDFDKFYQPETNIDYGYNHGGFGVYHRQKNSQQRSSQGFGDIFGERKKQDSPAIVPGF